jgi:phosphoglycolate phosphatase
LLIIFDLDGTLIDSARCVIHATQAAFEQHELPVPSAEQIIGSMGLPIEQSFVRWSGQDDATQLIAEFRVIYIDCSPRLIEVFPGLAEMLHQLHAAGNTLTIATSKKREVAEMNLRDCGLASYFARVVGSNDVQNYKPHPETAMKLLEEFEADPAETWVVGDSTFDLEMGRGAGCRTCAVTWGAHSGVDLAGAKPDAIVSMASELLVTLTTARYNLP